ncbi:MAG TPA: acetylxylan esterase [Candidatus Nanoarchaeia archaeon]|nr:acetylxylan esterase [Candidatus Nanoarchaeia archaeon]
MKVKKNHIYFGVIVLVLIVAGLAYYFNYLKNNPAAVRRELSPSWSVDKNGYLYYPEARGAVEFSRSDYWENGSITVSKIIYKSRGANIYGFLVLPKLVFSAMPGVVLLPGAGVSKESELPLAEQISQLGMAVLTIDSRGVGETGGSFPSLDEDYASFLQSKEPTQHLIVYDALKGFDLLRSAPFIDKNRVIIAGESFGGRVAIIAAAVDKNVEGTLAISTAGFHFPGGNETSKDMFVKSIDSDHYIDDISPRKLVMIHNYYDKNILVSSAATSFQIAQEPKGFLVFNDTTCNHGYCDSMYQGLVDGLGWIVGLDRANAGNETAELSVN